MYVPNVEIKPYQSKYRDKIKQILMDLQKFYPDIEHWWDEKEIHKIEDGQDYCFMVLDGRDSVVGVAISGYERESTAKLKTFCLSKEFEGYSLGVELLKEVLNYWMKKRVRRIFVTFAEEELEELRGFFDKFGFLMDGFEPHFYRDGKTEYHMSKTFVYDTVDENSFEDFVKNYLLRTRGIIPESDGSEFLAFEDTMFSKTPRKIFVKIIKDKEIDITKLYREVLRKIEETKSIYAIVISYYPLSEFADNGKIKVIDGFLLENIFYPLRLRRSGYSGVILPISKEYADRLLELDEPQKRIMGNRLRIRNEKHYFSGKIDELKNVNRGWTFIFYQKKGGIPGAEGVIGEAKIKFLTIENARGVIKKYGLEKSAFLSEEEILEHSNKGRIALFLLTCVKRYPRKIPLSEVREIIPEVNFWCQLVTDEQINEMRKSGENDLNSY